MYAFHEIFNRRYEAAVQKATSDLATLKYTEGSYEESEEKTRNMKIQVC